MQPFTGVLKPVPNGRLAYPEVPGQLDAVHAVPVVQLDHGALCGGKPPQVRLSLRFVDLSGQLGCVGLVEVAPIDEARSCEGGTTETATIYARMPG